MIIAIAANIYINAFSYYEKKKIIDVDKESKRYDLPSYFDALKQYQIEELEDEEELFRSFGFYILN